MHPYEEYQPTATTPPDRHPPTVIRAAGTLTAILFALVLLVIGVASRLPGAPAFAYQTATTPDTLYLYDVRASVRVTALRAGRIRGVKWLPGGDGFALTEDTRDDWYALQLTGEHRQLSAGERAGALYWPSPDWERYLRQRDGRLLLYDPAQASDWVPLLSGVDLREVVWSPDGARVGISFGVGGSEARQVGVINLKTSIWEVVTPDPALYARLAWSPDSATLAYLELPGAVHLYNAEAGTAQRLQRSERETVSALAWSSDGSRIAYGLRGGALRVTSVDGATAHVLLPGLADDTRLAWSPDGPWLVVRSGTLVEHQLTLLNVETGEQRALPGTVSSQAFVAWQP